MPLLTIFLTQVRPSPHCLCLLPHRERLRPHRVFGLAYLHAYTTTLDARTRTLHTPHLTTALNHIPYGPCLLHNKIQVHTYRLRLHQHYNSIYNILVPCKHTATRCPCQQCISPRHLSLPLVHLTTSHLYPGCGDISNNTNTTLRTGTWSYPELGDSLLTFWPTAPWKEFKLLPWEIMRLRLTIVGDVCLILHFL